MSRRADEAPTGEFTDNSYANPSGPNPVVNDTERVEDPIDARTADTDQQLERDDADAIDSSNIIKDRTRGATKPGAYREPGDEEGLPGPDDGTSSTR